MMLHVMGLPAKWLRRPTVCPRRCITGLVGRPHSTWCVRRETRLVESSLYPFTIGSTRHRRQTGTRLVQAPRRTRHSEHAISVAGPFALRRLSSRSVRTCASAYSGRVDDRVRSPHSWRSRSARGGGRCRRPETNHTSWLQMSQGVAAYDVPHDRRPSVRGGLAAGRRARSRRSRAENACSGSSSSWQRRSRGRLRWHVAALHDGLAARWRRVANATSRPAGDHLRGTGQASRVLARTLRPLGRLDGGAR